MRLGKYWHLYRHSRKQAIQGLLNLSIIGAVKVNAVDLDLVSVPSDTTISGLELGVSDTVEAHEVVEASVGLAESDGQVGDFCIESLRQFE